MPQDAVTAPWMEWFYLAAICLIALVIGAVLATVIWFVADHRAKKKAALTQSEKQQADA